MSEKEETPPCGRRTEGGSAEPSSFFFALSAEAAKARAATERARRGHIAGVPYHDFTEAGDEIRASVFFRPPRGRRGDFMLNYKFSLMTNDSEALVQLRCPQPVSATLKGDVVEMRSKDSIRPFATEAITSKDAYRTLDGRRVIEFRTVYKRYVLVERNCLKQKIFEFLEFFRGVAETI